MVYMYSLRLAMYSTVQYQTFSIININGNSSEFPSPSLLCVVRVRLLYVCMYIY